MRKALGRGLGALISVEEPKEDKKEEGALRLVSVDKIHSSPLQARKNFDPEKISELASSIKQHGLAQPLLASYDAARDSYELIAGERRLRACILAGLKEVEVLVRESKSKKERMLVGLIENLQRQDLNAIEEAFGYLRLMKEFQISQNDLAHTVGKSKSAVSNTLRLLDLSEEIQKAVQFGQMSEGHARALLMIPDALERNRVFKIVLENKLSVREAEDLSRQTSSATNKRAQKKSEPKSPDVAAQESRWREILGTNVDIRMKKSGEEGQIVIHFYNLEEFDRLSNFFKK
jgi:ParB family chromosome partitioning protein